MCTIQEKKVTAITLSLQYFKKKKSLLLILIYMFALNRSCCTLYSKIVFSFTFNNKIIGCWIKSFRCRHQYCCWSTRNGIMENSYPVMTKILSYYILQIICFSADILDLFWNISVQSGMGFVHAQNLFAVHELRGESGQSAHVLKITCST